MNRNDFNRFITEDAVPRPGDMDGIQELTDLFPWFHSAHLVLLRGLKENSDIKFESQLKNSALFVADREVLYHYLFMNQPVTPAPAAEIHPVVKEDSVIAGENNASAGLTEEEVTLRSREELIAEIESRLNEISMPPPVIPEIERKESEVSDTEETAENPEGIMAIAQMPETSNDMAEETVFEIELEPNFSARTEGKAEISFAEDEELLELTSPGDDDFKPEEPAKQLTPDDLIERFIKTSPRLERLTTQETGPVKDLSEASTNETGSFITETLARIYVNQGYYFKAINIYEKLALKYPEKSAYFASRIEKIKELIK